MASENIEKLGIEAKADVESAISKLNKLSKSIESLDKTASNVDTGAVKSSTDKMAQYYDQLQVKVDRARRNIQKSLSQNLSQMTDSQIARAQVDARNKLASAQNRLLSAKEGSQGQTSFAIQIAEARQQIAMLNGEMENRSRFKIKGGEETVSTITRIGKALNSGMTAINGFASKVDALGTKIVGFGKRVLSAINPLNHLRNEQNKLSLSSTLLGRAFLKVARMFRIMVTRMLIRGFISHIREGFQNIAKYSEEVNQAFSNIGASAKTLYNSVASAFAPLVQAIAPYITQALDFITKAFNKVAELISALTGKSYYIKATKFNYNYAKSLDNTSKASKKTAKNIGKTNKQLDKQKKKVKELKSETIGIDRLNVIEKNTPNTDTNKNKNNAPKTNNVGGTGNTGATPQDMFDTKPVSKKMKKLANMIKRVAKKLFEPIKKAWDKVGGKVINSWKRALKSVWKTIKAIGRDFLKMWGQKKTQKIFEDLLLIIADIGDIVANLSDNFRKAWNWNKTGLHILENARDVVGIIVSGIRDCSKYTKKWAKNLNFKPLLKSIERYTKSLKKLMKGLVDIGKDFYKIVVLGISKWVVEKGLPKLIDVFTDFNNEVDWQSLRKSLKEVWKGVEKFGETVGEGLIDFIDWLADGIRDLLNSRWFKGFLEGIGKALQKIKPKQVTSALKLFFKVWAGAKVVKGATSIFTRVGSKLKWLGEKIEWFKYSNVGQKIIGAFKGTGKKVSGNMSQMGSSVGKASSSVKKFVSTCGKVATAVGIFVAVTKAFEVDTQGGDVVSKPTKKMADSIDKLSDKAEELQEDFSDLKESVKETNIAPYEKVKLYYNELKKITNENGKIKSGYKKQAQFYIKEINKKLHTNVKLSGNYVKNIKSATKALKKQKNLIAQKVGNKMLEEGGEDYYKAKSGSATALDKATKAYNEYKKSLQAGSGKSEKETEKLYNNYKKAYKTYVKFETQKIRYENLLKAVASGNRKEIEKAIADFDKPVKVNFKPKFKKKMAIKTWKNYLKEIGKVGFRFNNIRVSKDFPKKFKKALTRAIEKGKISPDKAISFTKVLAKAKYNGVQISNKIAKGMQSGKVSVDKAISYTKALTYAKQKGVDVSKKLKEGIDSGKIDLKTAMNYANLLRDALAKGKEIPKNIGSGIKGNQKSVKTAIKQLRKIVNNKKKNKIKFDTKFGVDGKKKYKSSITKIANWVKKIIPKTVTTSVKVKARLSLKASRTKSVPKDFVKVLGTTQKNGHIYMKYEKANGKQGLKLLKYASGGFPKLGSQFIAGEKGAEFVGNINGKTGVASNLEITGIREEVEKKGNEQNQLLMQQNKLLAQLLEKNTDVTLDGVKLNKKLKQIDARSGYTLATT